jgi:hypothetical protein
VKGKADKWSARVVERESNGRRRPAAWTAWFIFFFIPKPNQFGLIRVGRFRHTKTGNRTEPDIFLNILIGSIGFFYQFGFFG